MIVTKTKGSRNQDLPYYLLDNLELKLSSPDCMHNKTFLNVNTFQLSHRQKNEFSQQIESFQLSSLLAMAFLIYQTSYAADNELQRYEDSVEEQLLRRHSLRAANRNATLYVSQVSYASQWLIFSANFRNLVQQVHIIRYLDHPMFALTIPTQFLIVFQQFRFIIYVASVHSEDSYPHD